MHVLAVANELAPTGGLERVQLDVHRGLHARGHHASLVYEEGGELLRAWEGCTEEQVRVTTARFRPGRIATSTRGAWHIARTIRRARPDVIYLHWYRHLHLVAPSARALRVPIVLHLHAPAPQNLGAIGRRLIRVPHQVLAVSRSAATGWRAYRDQITVLYNGVDLDHFRPVEPAARAAARAPPGTSAPISSSSGTPAASTRRRGWPSSSMPGDSSDGPLTTAVSSSSESRRPTRIGARPTPRRPASTGSGSDST